MKERQPVPTDSIHAFVKESKLAFKDYNDILRVVEFESSNIDRLYYSRSKELLFIGFDEEPHKQLFVYNQFTQADLDTLGSAESVGRWFQTQKHKCCGVISLPIDDESVIKV